MNSFIEQRKDALLLAGRILLVVLFVLFGWNKLIGFGGTEQYMAATGAPAPAMFAVVAIVMELVVGIVIAIGFKTRPLALLLALYTLGTAFIGHHYWTQSGMEQFVNVINFYKIISIIGGLLLLFVTGPGKYSLDRA